MVREKLRRVSESKTSRNVAEVESLDMKNILHIFGVGGVSSGGVRVGGGEARAEERPDKGEEGVGGLGVGVGVRADNVFKLVLEPFCQHARLHKTREGRGFNGTRGKDGRRHHFACLTSAESRVCICGGSEIGAGYDHCLHRLARQLVEDQLAGAREVCMRQGNKGNLSVCENIDIVAFVGHQKEKGIAVVRHPSSPAASVDVILQHILQISSGRWKRVKMFLKRLQN